MTTFQRFPSQAPAGDIAELKARIAALLSAIGAGAAQRERERQLPFEAIAQLAAAGIYTVRIPQSHGGPGGSVRDVIEVLLQVASVDSNVAQALRPGFAFIEGLLASTAEGAEEKRQRWFARYLQGAVLGNAGWELGGANGAIAARLVREGDHYRANGSKFYSTGALFADWVSAVALDEDEQLVSFILPRDREGLVLAGIARNALDDASRFAREHARPIKHSSAKLSVDDPYVELSVGDIAARAYGAEALVLRAAESIDRAWAGQLAEADVERAAVDVAQTQYLVAELALKAAETVFEVGGASTTRRSHNLDRHWRNARTVANHNPRHWKAAVVGAWQLKGTQPPVSGLF